MRPLRGSRVRRLLLALAVLSLTSVLGGCFGKDRDDGVPAALPPVETLSPKVFGILPAEEVWVIASDELRLHNAVYRPDTDEPVPVFINFSPYWGDTAMERGDAFSRYMVEEYVPRGYAVVLSAVRGTGHSEGCFEIGSDRESEDVANVVAHFADQDWSSGSVAAGGKSYDSTSQNGMVAKFPHPALKGLFHVSGITDMYRYTMHDGVPYGRGVRTVSFTSSYYATQGLNEYTGGAGGSGTPTDDPSSFGRLVGDACPEASDHFVDPMTSATAGQKTPYWVERDWTRSIRQSAWNGSIFFVHGLQDWNVQPDHIQPWMDEVLAKGDIEVLGWLHQWTRDGEPGGDGHVYPMRTDWNETMLRWLDAVLKGKDTGLDRLHGFESQGTDMLFRRSATWPPVLPGTFRLDASTAECNATCTVVDVDLLRAEGEALRIAGSPVVTVTWTANSPDPVLTAILAKTNATGRHWVGEATLRGAFRDSLETRSDVGVGETYTSSLAFYPLDAILEPGARWTLTFGAPTQKGTSAPLSSVLGEVPVYAGDVTYDVRGATLEASVLPASEGLVAQPAEMDCFTC